MFSGQGNPAGKFKFQKVLGTGAFGAVLLYEHPHVSLSILTIYIDQTSELLNTAESCLWTYM